MKITAPHLTSPMLLIVRLPSCIVPSPTINIIARARAVEEHRKRGTSHFFTTLQAWCMYESKPVVILMYIAVPGWR